MLLYDTTLSLTNPSSKKLWNMRSWVSQKFIFRQTIPWSHSRSTQNKSSTQAVAYKIKAGTFIDAFEEYIWCCLNRNATIPIIIACLWRNQTYNQCFTSPYPLTRAVSLRTKQCSANLHLLQPSHKHDKQRYIAAVYSATFNYIFNRINQSWYFSLGCWSVSWQCASGFKSVHRQVREVEAKHQPLAGSQSTL